MDSTSRLTIQQPSTYVAEVRKLPRKNLEADFTQILTSNYLQGNITLPTLFVHKPETS